MSDDVASLRAAYPGAADAVEVMEFDPHHAPLVRATLASARAEAFGCSGQALSNRLAWLEARGLLTSERYGRQRRYRVA